MIHNNKNKALTKGKMKDVDNDADAICYITLNGTSVLYVKLNRANTCSGFHLSSK